MNKFDLIVIDMDGVLANFRKGVSNLFGVELEILNGWNLYKTIGVDLDTFWDDISKKEDFWINLEKFPHVDELMGMIEKYTSEILICTHPAKNPESYRGKKKWLDENNLGKYKHFIGNANKGWLACGNRVLIDDYVKNVRSFEKKGGKGILFPQVYSLQFIDDLDELPDDKVSYVEEKLRKFAEETKISSEFV
ncbi:hypothetical protein KAX29_02195 [candidate division WOR-3 bacterium]|nr:hypothetical protein [candidate division WOR-3 bacterium]